MSLDAMKQALEALEQYTNVVTSVNDPNSWVTVSDGGKPARDAITALRAAIEQAQGDGVCRHCNGAGCVACDARHLPKQEPVCDKDPQGCWSVRCQLGKVCKHTAPRQWQGLTDEEKAELDAEYGDDTLAHLDAIEAKLKEKNNAR